MTHVVYPTAHNNDRERVTESVSDRVDMVERRE